MAGRAFEWRGEEGRDDGVGVDGMAFLVAVVALVADAELLRERSGRRKGKQKRRRAMMKGGRETRERDEAFAALGRAWGTRSARSVQLWVLCRRNAFMRTKDRLPITSNI